MCIRLIQRMAALNVLPFPTKTGTNPLTSKEWKSWWGGPARYQHFVSALAAKENHRLCAPHAQWTDVKQFVYTTGSKMSNIHSYLASDATSHHAAHVNQLEHLLEQPTSCIELCKRWQKEYSRAAFTKSHGFTNCWLKLKTKAKQKDNYADIRAADPMFWVR